jgi:hypothetical protein
MLIEKRLTIVGCESWADQNDRYSMELYKQNSKNIGFLGAYCVAKSSVDSFHQWKIFADGQSGVCIVFDKEKFESFYKSLDKTEYICGDVRYVPYKGNQVDQDQALCDKFTKQNLNNIPFIKRSGFSAEDEFRIIYSSVDKKQKVQHIPFDLSVIEQIILSPFLSDGLLNSVKSVIKKTESSLNKVSKSRLVHSGSWQKSLDRYASKVVGEINA